MAFRRIYQEEKRNLLISAAMFFSIALFVLSLISILMSPKVVAVLQDESIDSLVSISVVAFDKKRQEYLPDRYKIKKAVVKIEVYEKQTHKTLFVEKVTLNSGQRYEKDYAETFNPLHTGIKLEIIKSRIQYDYRDILEYIMAGLSFLVILSLIFCEKNIFVKY